MAASKWINQLRVKLDLGSDYAVAAQLGVSKQAISAIRSGSTKVMSDELSLRVANLLDIDPITVIADQRKAKARDKPTKAFWGKMTGAAKPNFMQLVVKLAMAAFGVLVFIPWALKRAQQVIADMGERNLENAKEVQQRALENVAPPQSLLSLPQELQNSLIDLINYVVYILC